MAINYSFTMVNGALTVNQAVLTVTAQNASKTYGAANPTFAYAMTGFVNGDTQAGATTGAPGLSTTATAASPAVGAYAITANPGTLASGNYSFTFVSGTLTVTQALLTVTANNLSTTYGVIPALTYTMTGFVNGARRAQPRVRQPYPQRLRRHPRQILTRSQRWSDR